MPKPARLEGIPPFEGVFPKSYSFVRNLGVHWGCCTFFGNGLAEEDAKNGPFFPVAVLNPRSLSLQRESRGMRSL